MLTLNAGANALVVAPERGAGLIGWMRGRTPILRRALPEATVGGNFHAMAGFPLVPYCNRIAYGRFSWDGTAYQLAPNFGDHPHTLHGVGWQRPWTTLEASATAVALGLDHRPDTGWPFPFRAEVRFMLADNGLTVTISMTNRHHAPAPGGIGLHPFFPKTDDPALRFQAAGAWQNGDDSLPSRHGPLPPDWDHSAFRPVSQSRLDNCFNGWGGTADIRAGRASLRVEASGAFRCLQVFTPHWAEFFCVEPVSHAPDAINRPDLPDDQAMAVLQPGQTLSGTLTFTLTD